MTCDLLLTVGRGVKRTMACVLLLLGGEDIKGNDV